MRKTESQKIALCGMLGALSVVLLLLGSALQIGTYAAPMLAAFLLIPVLEQYGTRYALTRARCWCIFCCLRCSGPPCWTSCWPTASGCWQHCWPRATCRSGCVTAHWRH